MAPPLGLGFSGDPELVIVGLATISFLILTFVMGYWVYSDAQKRGSDRAILWTVAVVGLAFLTLVGGFLVFGLYLLQRQWYRRGRRE